MPHDLRSIAHLLVCVTGAAMVACAMSETEFERYSMRVGERNHNERQTAVEKLARKGWVLIDDTTRFSFPSLDEASRQACIALRYHPPLDGGAVGDAAVAHVQISEPSAQNDRPPPMDVTAPLNDACAFFRNLTSELHVTKPDRTTGVLRA